ncbi:MAG: putative UDP-N-acetylglucosamine 2-epimerase [Candidatus Peregrinibacteria bacterium Gr01-1014_25]|nr:MAG: putative UDP-N-acetylglucosamine 2-epimerase [Candidatus Peregrinibacteria bacterium Gr01-1014_25]
MDAITYRSSRFYDDLGDQPDRRVHLVLVATKPDIIKQIPLYKELQRRGHVVVLGHTGQHFSENLSGGMLKEFGVEPDFNLNVRGAMHEIVSQIIGRLGHVIGELKARGKTVIPYVHGDTTTAMAASNAAFCHGFASVHVEAGIRTLTPDYEGFGIRGSDFEKKFDVEKWRRFLQDRSHWQRGSLEPYPEQFNTRCSEAASGLHFAPVELDREFLLSEGFPEDRIVVTGNSVVDATAQALATIDASSVFERHPVLAGGDFVRFCIHRRENCGSPRRFRAIYEAMKQLVLEGRTVLLISLFQTEKALEQYGLKPDIEELAAKHKNFVYSPVWSEYKDVIAAMTRAAVCATDSGSMQEEMNHLGVPCVTLRFGSDRSESAIAGGNIIAPPIDAWLIKDVILHAWDNASVRNVPKLYGANVSEKSVDAVERVLKGGEVFRNEEERLRM